MEPPAMVDPKQDPTFPVSAHWALDSWLFGEGIAMTLVEGMDPVEVLAQMVPVPAHALGPAHEVAQWAEISPGQESRTFLISGEVDGWTVVFEENGYQAGQRGLIERLAVRGRAATLYTNIHGWAQVELARNGVLLRRFSPGEPDVGDHGDALEVEQNLPFDRYPVPASVALIQQFTGFPFTEEALVKRDGRLAVGLAIRP